ncbi:MAG TPA: prepilin-type N-terminal cleavage/methylation domain-containing protein [Pyrinomonadaceae bacterium]|jgi:prepilin-type N-terminal cleavage/methylation domain-containing protein
MNDRLEHRKALVNRRRAARRRAARRQAQRTAERAAGFSLIELLIVVAIIGIIAALSIPNLLASRRAANEAAALSAVRTLSSAQEAYRATYGGGAKFATLSGLVGKKMVDTTLGEATTVDKAKSGYIFSVVTADSDASYCAGSAPSSANNGGRNFSSDTPGVLYVHPLAVATPPTSTAGGTPLNN